MRLLKEVRNLTGNYHVKSGMFHYFRGEYRQAEEFFRKALKDDAELSTVDRRNALHYITLSLMDLAGRLEGQGELEESITQLHRAAEIGQEFPDIDFRRGVVLEKLERSDEAIAAYRRAIKMQPSYLEAYVALGFCLLRSGRVEATAEAFEEARQLQLRRVSEPHAAGVEKLRGGDAEGAAELFHQAFRSSPALCEEYRRKGLDRLGEEDFEGAVSEFDRATQISPKYPDLHNFRGIALYELDRLGDAIESFRLSVELGPSYLVPRLNLAFALASAGELTEAESVLLEILEEDPAEPAALAKLEEIKSGRLPEKRRPVTRGATR
jgi:tetratricopeptide (TPR) repeat protein